MPGPDGSGNPFLTIALLLMEQVPLKKIAAYSRNMPQKNLKIRTIRPQKNAKN
jgi:hypothetical protein